MQLERLGRKHGTAFWRLFLSLAALSTAAIAVLTWLFSNAYEALLWRHVQEELRTAAAASAVLLSRNWLEVSGDRAQEVIRSAGARAGVRLTLTDVDGHVLADSEVGDATALAGMESHGNRIEFITALRSGEGSARRMSPTLGERIRYHAYRIDVAGDPVGVVRAALPVAPVAAEIAGVNRWLYAVAVALAAICTFISYGITRWLADPIADLAETARTIVAGQYEHRPSITVSAKTREDEITAVAAALDEIGQRVARSEDQLLSTSQTQATILEGMSESVVAVDRSERILFANAASGRMLGLNPAHVKGRRLLEAVRSHELRDLMREALLSCRLARMELTWRIKAPRVFDVLATPLPGNPPPGVVLVLRDVSEVKRLEQMRQQFVANVSHELKTPLSSIRAYTETLLGGASVDPVHCERFLQRIDEQAGRLQELIFDMLSLARIESSQAPLELVDLPLAKIVDRSLADFEPLAAGKQISLIKELAPGLQVHADEEAVRQILSNLVDNAIKYTPAAGRITVRTRLDDRQALLEVEDTGPGIHAEHHARLFERFYRVDKARSRELGGTGLGLSIVKHLAQAMGGAVSLKSQVGAGSTFTVRLCLGATSAPAV